MQLPIAFLHPWYLLGLLALGPVVWLWWRARNLFRPWREAISLALRTSILVLLALGLAGLQWVHASEERAVVFLLDASDSVDAEARAQGEAFIRAALAEMGADDRAAVVIWGANALVERPMSPARELDTLRSIPNTTQTDAGQAVRLGLALLPATAQRRMVLLSDGQINVAGGEAAARLAAAGGVVLDTYLLPGRAGPEAWIDAVDAPQRLYPDEVFSVVVRVQSRIEQPALVRLYAGDALVREEAALLHPGLQSFLFELSAGAPGFGTFSAQLVPQADTFYQNNALGTFVLIEGAPQVLVMAREPYPDPESGLPVDDGAHLVRALEGAGLQVTRLAPAYMPVDLADLGQYAALVLANVPASVLSPRQMDLLPVYVRDLGRGLVCVGGAESYGVGGYYRTPLEEALPVEMTIKDPERMPPLAIVFAIDKSGSMEDAAAGGGVRKLDLAKEAVLRSLELLNPGDQVGVVAFDSMAQWVWPLAPFDDLDAAQEGVATLRAGGGTDIYAGLSAAVEALEGVEAQLKHVILLTDGGASQEGLSLLLERLRAAGGTLSTVGVGQDAAPFLQSLAVEGGGRYHFTDQPASIPQIFVQETSLAQRAYLVEETIYPALAGRSPIVEGIAATPPLYGYVATTLKPAAQLVLAGQLDDPLLAQWQYGLGRAVAWTSDAKGQWARAWVEWAPFARFWTQAVRWTIVAHDDSGLEIEVEDGSGGAHIVVDVVQGEGGYGNDMQVEAHLVSPSLAQETVVLEQMAPGRYEADLPAGERGVYLVRVAAAPRQGDAPPAVKVTGLVRAYSPEYRTLGADPERLRHLAELGRGELLESPAQVFAPRDLPAVRTYREVWPWLLTAAAVLFPLDVAVRRVVITASDVRAAYKGVRRRIGASMHRRQAAVEAERTERLARLLAAKERAPAASESEPTLPEPARFESGAAARPEPAPSPAETPPVAPEIEPPVEEGEGDMTSRLLAAKRRARRER